MKHLSIALTLQLIFYLTTGNLWFGSLFGSAYFIGREIAQAEQRTIQRHYGNRRANAPWWCGFEPRAWDRKSLLDWFLPTVATALVAIFMS